MRSDFEGIKAKLAVHADTMRRVAERAAIDPRADVDTLLEVQDAVTETLSELDALLWPEPAE
jgi:hypothetical protein